MRLLIVCAVAALTAIVVVFVLREVDGPWSADSSIRTGIAGAAAGVVSVVVSRNLRKKD
ncbi:MAG: hypothetical protein ABL998_08145 [Planctomycetota bacterium]